MTPGRPANRHADAEPAPSEGRGLHPLFPRNDVDGGPPPAMTMTTTRRVNDFAAWYDIQAAARAADLALPVTPRPPRRRPHPAAARSPRAPVRRQWRGGRR